MDHLNHWFENAIFWPSPMGAGVPESKRVAR